MHIIHFEFMRTVFSHTEPIGDLRFAVVAFLLFCSSFVGVDPKLVVDADPRFVSISHPSNPGFVSISHPSNIC